MNYLVDTHLLLWSAASTNKLSFKARRLLSDTANDLWVSVASLWEVAIKRSLNRPDFRAEVGPLRAGLLANGYNELPVSGRHVISLSTLPKLHSDPFDRLLIAQALAEGMILLTSDRAISEYPGPIQFVG